VDVIDVTESKTKILVVVNAAVNLRVPLNAGNFLISRGAVSFVSMDSVRLVGQLVS
jgi:hypothetical protein